MLGSVIREIVAPVLREAPQECGIVSITSVKVSPDASYVDLTVSALKEPRMAVEYLESRIPDLKKLLGALERRIIPKIRFRLDQGQEAGNRVEELLKKLEG
jgi:ribosome-binding factor A